jgi:HSP20 family protein
MNTPTIRRRAPNLWRSLLATPGELDRILDRSFGMPALTPLAGEPLTWTPATDLVESNTEYTLTAELPGMDAKDVEVGVEGGILTVKGEKKSEKEEKRDGERWHIIERSYGSFERSFTLPSTVDAERIKAEFANGILTVRLPKRTESKGRRVAIEGSSGAKK